MSLLCTTPATGARRTPRVSVDAPAEPVTHSTIGWIEVRGRAGARAADAHDLLIAIDLSNSTLRDSGGDIDGDGPNGTTEPAHLAALAGSKSVRVVPGEVEVDLDDTIVMAELASAEALIERLPFDAVRVGLLAFSDSARTIRPIGADKESLLAGVGELRAEYTKDLRGTRYLAVLRKARRQLRREPGRARSLVLLTDGETYGAVTPGALVRQARSMGRAGIRLYCFVIGPISAASRKEFEEAASATGGALERIEHPSDIVSRLRALDLADLESVTIRNATTGRDALAQRQLPNGSFDGFVELTPGENEIHIEATLSNGRTRSAERAVVYEPGAGDDAALEALLENLRKRTAKLELWAEMERTRNARKRVVIERDED